MPYLPSSTIQSRGKSPFPDMESISKDDKQKYQYNFDVVRAGYSAYVNNETCVNIDNINDYLDALRACARGREPIEELKGYFSGAEFKDTKADSDNDVDIANAAEASRKGWFTGIFERVSPVPNMLTMAKSRFMPVDNDVKAVCVDIDASVEETKKMNEAYAKVKYKPVTDFMRKLGGLPASDNGIITDSYQGLMEIKKEGGFKPQRIIAVEELIKHTEDISYWSQSLKEKFFEGVFIDGCAMAHAKYDRRLGKVLWERLDPKHSGAQYSDYNDFRDSDFYFTLEYPTLNKIREIKDYVTNGEKTLDLEGLREIANAYKEYSTNSKEVNYGTLYTDQIQQHFKGLEPKVCVMHFYWIDVENTKESEYTNSKGKKARVPYTEGQEGNDRYKVIKNRTLKKYECSWIVGTNWIYDYGVCPNQAFKDKKVPVLGFVGYMLEEQSYVERLRPIARVFAVSWLRFVNAMAKAQADFYVIDVAKLTEVSDGGKKYSPTQMIQMMRQENVFFYMGDGMQQGGTNVPITRVAGTLTDDVMKELNIMEQLLRQAEVITGLSPVSLGASPNPNAPVKTTQIGLISTDASLAYLQNIVMTMKGYLAEVSIPMIATLIKADTEAAKAYAKVIGEDDVQSIKDSYDSISDIGIKLMPRPDDKLRERLLAYAQAEAGKGTLSSINLGWIDYQLNNGGNFLTILLKMDYLIRQKEKQLHQQQLELVDRQTQGNKEAAQVQAQAQQQTQAMKEKSEQNNIKSKAQADLMIANNNSRNEIAKMAADYKMQKGEDPGMILAALLKTSQGAMS
jgi:hypothetical protein